MRRATEAVGVAAVVETGEALLGEGPARPIATEALETPPVGGVHEGVGVEREAVDDGEAAVVLPGRHGGEGLGGGGEGEGLLEGAGAELLHVVVGGDVGVEEAPGVEALVDAAGEAAGDAGDILGRGRRQGHEADGAVVGLDEEAVRDEDVEVGRQLEGAAEVLGEGDGARVETAGDAEAAGVTALRGPDALEEGGEGEVEDGRVLEGEPAQAEGEGEGPLAVRRLREDVVDEVLAGERGLLAVAGGAEAAALAREADEELVTAGQAADADEAVAEDAAAQGGAHLAQEWGREGGAGGGQLGEALPCRPLQHRRPTGPRPVHAAPRLAHATGLLPGADTLTRPPSRPRVAGAAKARRPAPRSREETDGAPPVCAQLALRSPGVVRRTGAARLLARVSDRSATQHSSFTPPPGWIGRAITLRRPERQS